MHEFCLYTKLIRKSYLNRWPIIFWLEFFLKMWQRNDWLLKVYMSKVLANMVNCTRIFMFDSVGIAHIAIMGEHVWKVLYVGKVENPGKPPDIPAARYLELFSETEKKPTRQRSRYSPFLGKSSGTKDFECFFTFRKVLWTQPFTVVLDCFFYISSWNTHAKELKEGSFKAKRVSPPTRQFAASAHVPTTSYNLSNLCIFPRQIHVSPHICFVTNVTQKPIQTNPVHFKFLGVSPIMCHNIFIFINISLSSHFTTVMF